MRINLKKFVLFNPVMVRKIVRIKLPGRTLKSQRGLFHGLVVRGGHRITYADNKIPRPFKVNSHKMAFFSEILQKSFKLHVSMKAYKTIRKYGGFDNYILLTKPKNMYSLFGEYLRRVMLYKLNNPALNTRHLHIYGSGREIKRTNRYTKGDKGIWHPADYRHADLSPYQLGSPDTWTREEWATIKERKEAFDAGREPVIPYPELREAPPPQKLPELVVNNLFKSKVEKHRKERLAKIYRIYAMESAKEGLYFEDKGGNDVNIAPPK